MSFINVEIKARLVSDKHNQGTERVRFIREYLLSHKAEFRGTDLQTDTYFNVPKGRLKLREGVIENNLIYYERPDQAGPKNSVFKLVKVDDAAGLKEALRQSLGIKVVVIKKREIYYIGNVKFHIDEVPGLGVFTEIEAGNLLADLSNEQLKEQCDHFMKAFGIQPDDLVSVSYSDMLPEEITSG